MITILTALFEFVLFIFLGLTFTTLIKIFFFRDYLNTYLRILGFGAVTLIAGLIIAHGVAIALEKRTIDGLESIPMGLMTMGIAIGSIWVYKSKPRKIDPASD